MALNEAAIERRLKALEAEVRELRDLVTPLDVGSIGDVEVESQSIADNDRQYLERMAGQKR
jgi:hypothetical protein